VVIADGLTAWLVDHPEAVELAPDVVALARSVAAALEVDPGNAALAREFRLTLVQLRELGADADGEADLAAELSAAVGNVAESGA
jgi:hypothetical protein